MSDNIPCHIQMEIIEKVSDAKSLIRFRSVSKRWKSFIDSSQFIKGYGARHTQEPHTRRILSYKLKCSDCLLDELRFICLVEDDIETFKVQQQQEFVMSPLLKQYGGVSYVVGESHGLLCLYCNNNNERMLVIWNPCIGKSFGIAVPTYDYIATNYENDFCFGVCPVTSDPTVVMTVWSFNMLLSIEVFTLSSGVWNRILSGNYPRESIKFSSSNHVVIDKFIYWVACESTEVAINYMLVSFDMITKELKVVDLPDSLTNGLLFDVSVSKLRGSLVLSGYIRARCYGVWVMEHDSSFRKLFNIGASFCSILGFRKNGEPIFETREMDEHVTTLNVYDPGLLTTNQESWDFWIKGLILHGLLQGITTFA